MRDRENWNAQVSVNILLTQLTQQTKLSQLHNEDDDKDGDGARERGKNSHKLPN